MFKGQISHIEQIAGQSRIEKEIIEAMSFEECFRMVTKLIEMNRGIEITEVHIFIDNSK